MLATCHSCPYHCSPCSSCDVCKEQLVKWQINLIPLGWKIDSGKLLLVLLWLLCLLGSDFWHFLLAAVTPHKLHSQGPDKLVWHWRAAWPPCHGRVFLPQLPGFPVELGAREGLQSWMLCSDTAGKAKAGGGEQGAVVGRRGWGSTSAPLVPSGGWRWSRQRRCSDLTPCFSVCQVGWEEPLGHEERSRGTPCVWCHQPQSPPPQHAEKGQVIGFLPGGRGAVAARPFRVAAHGPPVSRCPREAPLP